MTSPREGTLVAGRYRLGNLLGTGGMAVVFKALDLATKKPVAVKLLKPEAVQKEGALERIRREGDLLRTLNHPGIVKVDTYGALEDGEIFVVMEFLEGSTLRQRMKSAGQMEATAVYSWLPRVCGALGYAHGRGIIHRDLKPENIFVAPGAEGDEVKVLDFGISVISGLERLTSTGELLGTPAYMSPEQLRGEGQYDCRTDVYALSVVVYEALAAMPPFQASTLTDLVVAILNGKSTPLSVYRPNLPDKLVEAIGAGMSPSISKRPPSVAEFLQTLEPGLRLLGTPPAVREPQLTSELGGFGSALSPALAPAEGQAKAGVPTQLVAPAMPPEVSRPSPKDKFQFEVENDAPAPAQVAPASKEEPSAPILPPTRTEMPSTSPRGASSGGRVVASSVSRPYPMAEDAGTSAELALPVHSRRWWVVLVGVMMAVLSGLIVVGLLHWFLPHEDDTDTIGLSPAIPFEETGTVTKSLAPVAEGAPTVAAEDAQAAPNEQTEATPMQAPIGTGSMQSRNGSRRRTRVKSVITQEARRSGQASNRAPAFQLPRAPSAEAASNPPPEPIPAAPRGPAALLREARGALRSGDTQACLELASQALEQGAGSSALRLQGDCHLRAGRASLALQNYERFCRIGRDHPAIDEVRGLVRNLGGNCP